MSNDTMSTTSFDTTSFDSTENEWIKIEGFQIYWIDKDENTNEMTKNHYEICNIASKLIRFLEGKSKLNELYFEYKRFIPINEPSESFKLEFTIKLKLEVLNEYGIICSDLEKLIKECGNKNNKLFPGKVWLYIGSLE